MVKKIHLICNAHLDPVWMWEWEEGAAEAISTFRTAVEICEQNDSFVFNHNEVILYKWVNEYDPELFKRIQKLVKAGKWHIMGGWYLQPDCNMPCGESFVRQILLGRAYFKKYFNAEPKTAINFDPFGHTRGLVQILAKSGYDSYLFGRPLPEDCVLPAEDFIWTGYDGSQIAAHRFAFPYNSGLGKARQKLEKKISDNPDKNLMIMLWGVGNHGGGPSKKDVRDINRFIKKTPRCDITHSTPEEYFKDIRRSKIKLPYHEKDINSWAPGCYTSQIRIKQRHRQLENALYMTEKMVSAAAAQGLMKYPSEDIHNAFCDLMTVQFHDILPGTSVPPVEEYALRLTDHGLEIVTRLKTQAFFALAAGQSKPVKGLIPILVFNPHPFKVKQIIECEFNLPDVNWDDVFTDVYVYKGKMALPCQVEHEMGNSSLDWRKKAVFWAELEPCQMNRFDCTTEVLNRKPPAALKTKRGRIVFRTKDLEIVINTGTGLVDKYKVKGVDSVGPNAFEPIVMKDIEDSWIVSGKSFREVAGRFKLMDKKTGSIFSGLGKSNLESVRIIEDGPARSIVEALFSYNNSFICQHYKLPKYGTEIEVETRVYWNEKTRMLKLSIPIVGKDIKYLGQVAYGVEELPDNGNEAVSQKWVATVSRDRNFALTCINDGIYGSDFSEDGLRLTLLRSAAYSSSSYNSRPMVPQDRFWPRMEQGERVFKFWFNGGNIAERLKKIDREALVRNEKSFALSFYPSGGGKKPKPFAILSDDVIQITAIKKAENGNGFIIRLFEPTGKRRTAILSLPFMNKKMKISLGGFEIKTLMINPRNRKCIAVDIIERKDS